jgi:16S rRNA (adenine1518-N6/adenine1519-N6)-dimethyltransferase
MKSNGHIHKKSLGQNFLNDIRILQRMVDACHLSLEDCVVEVGPGQGVLTRLIAPKVKKLTCIETDRDLIKSLQDEFLNSNVEIIHDDFLKWDFAQLSFPSAPAENLKVIGNIPYYISTPIIEKIIEQRQCLTAAYLTVQLEFGQRMAAVPGSKEYGSLSCFVQYYADVKVLFKVKNTCFKPAPKVDSCFVQLTMRKEPLYKPKDEVFLFKVIHSAFGQRRKTISNSLSLLGGKQKVQDVLENLKINPKARAEELSLDIFVKIANELLAVSR